jgi:hypothetical protein
VEWYPWGPEAFRRAQEFDLPIFLSIGYSACHWCHVMAHESFEDPATAADLAAGFVSIKVDREERPDIDAIYMEAVQAMAGRGGWPMTVFLTPDARPFFGGTYFPPTDRPGMPSFRRVLASVRDAWESRRPDVEQQASALADAVARQTTLPDHLATTPSAHELSAALDATRLLDTAIAALAERFDPTWGGFSPAPKFPQPALIELCLQHWRSTGRETSLAMATTTLGAMAAGGIYDHLDGGFSRYSTDATWTVPHFEKMLTDQAGLLGCYVHAWQATGDPRWRQVVEETVGYVLRDLANPDGGICSAQDADAEGVEGKFSVWTLAELRELLGPRDAAGIAEWFGVTEAGNFEGASVLRRPLGAPLAAPLKIEQARARVAAARARRVHPERDDKVLTEWNAMWVSALAQAAGAFERSDWAAAAVRTAEFLFAHLRREDGRWLRSWQEDRAQHLAYAGDYAWLLDACVRLAELTGDVSWVTRAEETAAGLLALFADEETGVLFTTGGDAETLLVRPVDLLDGATPSASSVAGSAFLRLSALTGDKRWRGAGESLLAVLGALGAEHPLAIAHAIAGTVLARDLTEVVVSGDRSDLLAVLRRRYEPGVVLAWGEPTPSPLWEGRHESAAYVCRDFVCHTPAATPGELIAQLDAARAELRRGAPSTTPLPAGGGNR